MSDDGIDVTVSLSPQVYESLKEFARYLGTSVNEAIEIIVKEDVAEAEAMGLIVPAKEAAEHG
jgi:hypothetical protein